MRQFLLTVGACALGLALAAPAHADDHDGYKEYLKRLKEQRKREREFYKEQQKREDEYYREMEKAEAELDREQWKRDEERWKEQAKRQREWHKKGKGRYGKGGHHPAPGYHTPPPYDHYDRRPAHGRPGARFEFRFSYPAPYRPAPPPDHDD